VILSPSARGDLADIVGYISRHNAPGPTDRRKSRKQKSESRNTHTP